MRAIAFTSVALFVTAGCVSDKLLAELTSEVDASSTTGRLEIPLPLMHCNPCSDFPSAPIIDTTNGSVVPANVADLFAETDGGAVGVGPCLIEPEPGSLVPRNWLRPRFHVIPAAGQSLFEIRLHADIERNDLVVYTSSTTWTLPKDIWTALTNNVIDQPITITVRGVNAASAAPEPSIATIGTITIAPAEAGGSIVYWTTTGELLKGFSIGDETTSVVVRPEQTRGKCIGCHSSTPDGKFVAAAVSSSGSGNGDPAHIELRSGDGKALEPTYLTPSALALLAREQQHLPVFSKAHWSTGDRIVVTTYQQGLAWTDVEAKSQTRGESWDMLARVGDPNSYATHPAWNHNGSIIAYSSVGMPSTIAVARATDIYMIPYGARLGGKATPLAGASEAGVNEYYPSFSADDRLIAFTRSAGGSNPPMPFSFAPPGSTYSDPEAEVYVITADGGVPVRLAANDPPACSGKKSPGLTNSWAKWSPEVITIGNKTYYWLTFSSNRLVATTPQLYVTALVVDASGQITTYPANYLWNQPATESNHTPAWDVLQIPSPPIN
jgi:hypothetical protein